jgi:hypothetical protein
MSMVKSIFCGVFGENWMQKRRWFRTQKSLGKRKQSSQSKMIDNHREKPAIQKPNLRNLLINQA